MNSLNILVTTRCPLACRHCLFGCTPQGDQLSGDVTMTLDQIRSCVDQAIALNGPLQTVGLSGGEPFLLGEQLVDICDYIASRGLGTSLVTSAYWASSEQAAIQKLRPLAKNLKGLSISVDTFHADAISTDRAYYAARAASHLKIGHIGLQIVTSRSSMKRTDLIGWGDLLEEIKVEEIPCLPVGNAAQLPEDELLAEPGIPQGRCSSPSPVLRPDGDFYFCCSAGGIAPALRLGNVWETPMAKLWRRFLRRGLHRILIQDGPAAFVPMIRQAGAADRLKPAYVGICHLCNHLLTDPFLLEIVERQVAEWEIDHIKQQFGPLVGLAKSQVPV